MSDFSTPVDLSAVYEPLSSASNQLRLLVVEPGRDNELVCCSLIIDSLDAELRTAYETVSYCWGDAMQKSCISVNGKQVYVPLTSQMAIARMRLSHRERILWIDAICIDQSNMGERGHQVAMMGWIYRKGDANLIYLGSDSEGKAGEASTALRVFAERISDALQASSAHERKLWRLRSSNHLALRQPPLISATDLESIAGLFALSWFTRLWVVQEAYFAVKNTCYWGSEEFPLEQVLNVAMVSEMPRLDSKDLQGFIAAGEMWNLRLLGPRGGMVPDSQMWFHDLFFLSRRRSTGEPRDHVYAMYDLLTMRRDRPIDFQLLMPDYCKSVWEVYRDASKAMIQSDRQWLLGEVCHRSNSDMVDPTTTSWTVSWQRVLDLTQDHVAFHWSPELGLAGALPGTWGSLTLCDCDDQNIINFRGLDLGSVAWVTSPALTSDLESSSAAKKLLATVFPMNDTNLSRQQMATLLSGGWYVKDFESLEHAVKGLSGLLNHWDLPTSPLTSGSDAYTFRQLLHMYSRHRCFFETGSGHIGSGPKIMQMGDRVAVLHGALFASILRPTGKDDDSFFFVGNALIPGLMRGGALNMGLETRSFRLR